MGPFGHQIVRPRRLRRAPVRQVWHDFVERVAFLGQILPRLWGMLR